VGSAQNVWADFFHSLSPCGHVGCLECLLNWFTTGQDEEDATDPIHREKTCPQCRTLIVLPPTPSYVLKNVIEEIGSSGPATQSRSTPVANTVNPWSRIFALASEELDDDDDEDDEEEEETYSDRDSHEEDDGDAASSDSPSESSDYHTEFQVNMEHLDQVMTWELIFQVQTNHTLTALSSKYTQTHSAANNRTGRPQAPLYAAPIVVGTPNIAQ
jgi:Zinc finger, C3HC4 type (RING finger)